ncbi:MAG TPA: dephospho-CoA kinase, partial [Roseiflexaceae bacterium]|nr:dephospho-CoA kinase [Roseiflexaceae bacterium]
MSNWHTTMPALRNPHYYLIGLTGNIACGKSTVVAMLREYGAHVLDADAVTHELQQPGQPVYHAIVEAFGPGIVPESGGPIDRRALGAIVFADPAELRRLEQIVHPAVRQRIAEWLQSLEELPLDAHGRRVAVIDAIKLLEGGWKAICDAVWVVACRPEQQIERLVSTRAMSESEAQRRVDAQPPQSEKIAQADVVIDNSGTLASTQAQ